MTSWGSSARHIQYLCNIGLCLLLSDIINPLNVERCPISDIRHTRQIAQLCMQHERPLEYKHIYILVSWWSLTISLVISLCCLKHCLRGGTPSCIPRSLGTYIQIDTSIGFIHGIVEASCIARNRTWLYRLPQSQKTMYIFSKAYCYLYGTWENF